MNIKRGRYQKMQIAENCKSISSWHFSSFISLYIKKLSNEIDYGVLVSDAIISIISTRFMPVALKMLEGKTCNKPYCNHKWMPWRRKTLNGFVAEYHTFQKRADYFIDKVVNSTLAHLSYDHIHILHNGNVSGDNAARTFLHGDKTGLTVLNRSQIHRIPCKIFIPF